MRYPLQVRYLAAFHDADQEKLRIDGKAFIPAPNEHLRGLVKVNADMVGFMQSHNPQKVATLDQDATLVATAKLEALYCYKKFKAYQPFNTWWAEQGMVLHTEFRDGNVPAGYEQLRVFKEVLALLPANVETVRLRSSGRIRQDTSMNFSDIVKKGKMSGLAGSSLR